MAKKKLTPRGTWQATGMQRLRIPKTTRASCGFAEELKLKAEGLIREADDLLARAELIEGARNTNPA